MTDSMASAFTWYKVQAIPGTSPSYSGNQLSSERAFLVPCAFAQEFGLRMLGKFYKPGTYETPNLPARYPIGTVFDDPEAWTSRLKMNAAGFRIDQPSDCCFEGRYKGALEESQWLAFITDAESFRQMERHHLIRYDGSLDVMKITGDMMDPECQPAPEAEPPEDCLKENANCSCLCKVTINYQEQPWDCAFPDVDVLEHTALSIERSAGYEMFTLPNRNLVWKDIVASEETDSQLKGDTYASVIIPKTDITVTWHNVPVKRLCEIEAHLTKYRGTVNGCAFTLLSDCLCAGTDTPDESCDSSITDTCKFEAETILFVDWSEDKQARTRGFYKMNTTSLVLHFKQKRIEMDSGVAGWNHLYLDRSGTGIAPGPWQRVVVKRGDNWTEPLFKLKNFSNIFNLESADNVTCP